MKKRVQKLVDLECICPTCHSVHHWGFSEASGYNMEYLISYACKINNCTRQEWLAYVDKCYREWAELSKIEWTLYFSKRYKIEV